MHDLLATATFSRDEKRRGSKALGSNAVNLHIFREKCADTPYISRKRRKNTGGKKTMERQRKIITRLFKSSCVSMTTPLCTFDVLIGQHPRWSEGPGTPISLFLRASCLFNGGAA